MLIEDLLFEIRYRKDSLKHVNNVVINEVNDNYCTYKGYMGEVYNKVNSLLYANSVIIESMEKVLSFYQEEVDNLYKKEVEEKLQA